MSTDNDLQTALELLRKARNQVDDNSAEAVDEFIELMEQPIVKVRADYNPLNPRVDCDNAGVMFCRHHRYTLGDKGAEDPFEEVAIFELEDNQDDSADSEQYRIEETRLTEAQELLGEWHRRILHEKENEAQELDAERTFEAYDYLAHLCEADTERRLRTDIALILPLYLYDHSGITMSHGSFNDRWDSGQVGWHYITKKVVQDVWGGDLEKAKACLEAELKTYDHYLRGNVWGYTIETRSGEHIASCWGFIGDELEETGMLEYVQEKYRPLLEEAWENRSYE